MEITYEEARELTREMTSLQCKLMEFGLYKTYRLTHEASKQLGWELAEIIDGRHTTKLIEEKVENDKDS